MTYVSLKLISICLIAGALSQTNFSKIDWCDPSLCENDPGTHIACKHDGKFASTCKNARILPMTAELQKAVLDKHNVLRSKIASGNEVTFPSATRMSALAWDDILAKLAELNCKQCIMKHDKCRNTPNYMISGQNLGTLYTIKPFATDSSVAFAVGRIQSWYDELSYMPPEIVDSYQSKVSDYDEKGYGHAAAMINARIHKVGCAVCQYTATRRGKDINATELACNYASTNLVGAYVYVGGKAASECQLGTHGAYKALCTVNEPINPNEGVE